MKKYLPAFDNSLTKRRFYGLRLAVTILIWLFVAVNASALKTNVTYTGTACAGGVLPLNGVLSNTTPNIPGGHRTGGYWSIVTPGLTLSNPLDPNAVLSGFPNAGTYVLNWNHSSGHVYTITFVVQDLPLPDPTLSSLNGTNDVLLCAKQNVSMDVNPNNLTNYRYFVNSNTTGLNSQVYSGTGSPAGSGSYTVTTSQYNPLDRVYSIVTASNGCQDISNYIRISTVNNVSVRVVGGASICKGNVLPNEVLEVIPYVPSAGFTYTWTTPTGTVVNSPTVTTSSFGNYYVTVSHPTCGTFQSNTVSVQSYDLPDVAVTPAGPVKFCSVGGSQMLTATLSATPGRTINYYWQNSGSLVATGATNTTAINSYYTATGVGTYRAVIKEYNNEECWKASNEVIVTTTEIEGSIIAANSQEFCQGTSYNPQLLVNVTGGNAPYRVVINGVTFNNLNEGNNVVTMPAIIANTTYQIGSINDATGCLADLTTYPPATVTFTVVPAPLAQVVTGPDVCQDPAAPSLVTIGLANTEIGVQYELLYNGAQLVPAMIVDGTGAALLNAWTRTLAGTYTVRAIRGNCIPVTMTGDVIIRNTPNDQAFAQTGTVCLSGTIGLVSSQSNVQYRLYRDNVYLGIAINGSDGTPINFPVQTAAGTYTIQAFTLGGSPVCSRLLSGSLIIINPVNYTLQAFNNVTTYCQGTTPTGITLVLSGSELSYTYQLRNITTNALYGAAQGGTGGVLQWLNVVAGRYQVVVTTPEGCTESYGDVTISENPLPSAVISIDPLNSSRCENIDVPGFNLTIQLTGTAPFTYTIRDDKSPANSWTFVSNTSPDSRSFDPNSTTTYTIVNVSDNSGCSNVGTGSATITVNPVPVVGIVGPNEACDNQLITLSALPSGAQYSYSWSTTESTQAISVRPNTTQFDYSVTVTSTNGCAATANKTVLVRPLPVVTFSGLDASYCLNHGPDGLTGNPSVPGVGSFFLDGNPMGGTSFIPANAGTGVHSVYYAYTDQYGCYNQSAPQQTVVNPLPVVSIANLEPTYCHDSGPVTIYGVPFGGTFSVQGGGGLSYTAVPNSGVITINPSLSLPGTTYTIVYSYTDGNGCMATANEQTEIIDLNSGSLSISGLAGPYCPTDNTPFQFRGLVNGLPITGGNGQLSGNGVTNTDFSNATADFIPALAGVGLHTITFRYTSPNGCIGVVTRTVQVGTILTTNLQASYCEGEPPVTITGNPAGGYFEITPPSDPAYTVNNSSFSLDPTTWALADDGMYKITYVLPNSPAMGCDTRMDYMVNITKLVDASFTGLGDNYCENAQPVLLSALYAQPGDQVAFSGPGISGNYFRAGAAGVGTHTIRCTITSSNGCISFTDKIVTVIPQPVLDILNLNASYCETDAIFQIEASNKGQTGTYNFESFSSIQGQNPLIYTAGDDFAQFDPSVGPGVYQVVYTFIPDAATGTGCESRVVKVVEVFRNDPVNFGGLAASYCKDGTGLVTLIGNFSGGTFTLNIAGNPGLINNGNGTATLDVSQLSPGIYQISYLYNNGSCDAISTKQFEVLPSPEIFLVSGGGYYCLSNPVGVPVILSDSQVGVSYELMLNGSSMSPARIMAGTDGELTFANVVAPGMYTIEASNPQGCVMPMNGQVQVSIVDLFLSISSQNETCRYSNDGIAQVTASGGVAPYSYEWRDNLGNVISTGSTAGGLAAGSYTITVTDATGCADSRVVNITEPDELIVVLSVTPASCDCTAGNCDGSVSVLSVTGGTPGYTITWPSGNIGDREDGLAAGAYSVTVTDANNCSIVVPFVVGSLAPLTLVEDMASHTDNTCNGSNQGAFTVIATGGSGQYEFSRDNVNWFASATNTYSFTTLAAGSYPVWVRDLNHSHCIYQMTNNVVVSEPDPLTLVEVLGSHRNVDCNGLTNGQIEVLANGGSGFYEYTIDGVNWQVSPIFGNLAAATRYIWVRDANDSGCVYTGMPAVIITQPLPLQFSVQKTDITCNGAADGVITVNASGGGALTVFAYSIDGGATWQAGNQFANLPAGNYDVMVKDAVAAVCETAIIPVTISEPAVIGAALSAGSIVDVKCFGEATGSFSINPIPATASLEYSINGGAWTPSRNFTGLTAGTYSVSVRNGACVRANVLSVTIAEPLTGLQITNAVITPVSCAINSTGFIANGAVSITVTGGTPPYNYQWTALPTNNPVAGNVNNPAGLPAGTYRVVVTDANSTCSVQAEYTITQPASWQVTSTITHVSVTGGNDGVISLTSISGGTSPYQVTWADGATYDGMVTRSNLGAGLYSYTITDANGCTWSETLAISDGSALDVIFTGHNVNCFGASTGIIDVLIANGTPNYNLAWSALLYDGTTINGSATNIGTVYHLQNLKAGTYSLVITDASGAGVSVSDVIVISQPFEALSISGISTNVVCYGENNGTLAVQVTGGTPMLPNNYTIDVLPGTIGYSGNALGLNNLSPGSYTVWATDRLGCQVSQAYVVSESVPLVVNHTKTNITCNGGTDGAISVNISGRPAGNGYRYDWYQVVGGIETAFRLDDNATINGLSAGTYRLRATSLSDACEAPVTDIEVTENLLLGMNVTVTHVTTCYGESTGRFDVSITGGKAPYSLNYGSGGLTGDGPFVVSNLPAGNYNLQVTDANGCVAFSNHVINQPAALVVDNVVSQMDCSLDDSGTLSFSVRGGTVLGGSHQYYLLLQGPDGTNYSSVVNMAAGGSYNASYSNLREGSYNLFVRDNLSSTPVGCQFALPFVVTRIKIEGTVTNTACSGLNNGAISSVTITGTSPNYTFIWSTANGLGLNPGSLNQSGLSSGTYTLTVTDLNRVCVVSRDFVVGNLFSPVIDAVKTNVTCSGGINGAIVVNKVDGMTPPLLYYWNGSATPGAAQLTGLSAGTVQLIVVDANGCMASQSFDVIEPQVISFNLSTALEQCEPYGRSIVLSSLSGGSGAISDYTYSYTGPGVASGKAANLIGMDAPVPAASLLTGITTGGNYAITVYDKNLCSTTQAIVIPGEIRILPVVDHLECNGGSNGTISLVVSNGSGIYSYQWTKLGDPGFTSTDKDLSGLMAGTYVVRVTDNVQGCVKNVSIEVTEPLAIQLSAALTHLSCAGAANGRIVLTALGGTGNYSYYWSSANGTGLLQGAKDQAGLSGGTYLVTVTDDNGCQATASYTISEPLPIDFALSVTDRTCDGIGGVIQIINPTGGSGSYYFTWAGPGITAVHQNTLLITGLSAGDYTVTMTDVNSGGQNCSVTKTVSLTADIELDYVVSSVTCGNIPDGAIDVTVQGGLAPFTYFWSTADGGNIAQGFADQSGLPSGTYRVLVTDARGCTYEADIFVPKMSKIQLMSTVQNVLCYGENTGRINVSVAGGSGNYSYQWTGTGSGLVNGLANQSNLSAGSYTLLVIDNVSGCQESQNFLVVGPPAPIAINSINVTNILCKGEFTGAITITASGGSPFGDSPFYRYSWTGPGAFTNSATQTNLPAGDYQVVVTDANGCNFISPVITITEPTLGLAASVATVTDVTAFGGNNGSIEISINGGTGSYSIAWSEVDVNGVWVRDLPADITLQTGLTSGFYRAVITDGNGCVFTLDRIFVNQPGGALTLLVSGRNILPCNGNNNGQISVNVTGGVLPYTLRWRNSSGILGEVSASSVTIDNLPAGIYEIIVVDANNETRNEFITITEPPLLQLNAQVISHVACYGDITGRISYAVTGGVVGNANNYYVEISGPGGYYQSLSTIQPGVTYTFDNLRQGSYFIRIIDDSNGDGVFNSYDCSVVRTLIVNQPEAHVVVSDDQTICDGQTATIKFIVSNWDVAANPLRITLQNGDVVNVNTSPYFHTFIPSASGVYSIVSVTDAVGCSKGTFNGTATVMINPLPTAHIRSDAVICLGQSTQLSFDLTGVAPWTLVYGNGTFSTTVANITSSPYTVNVSPLFTTGYSVISIADAYCSNAGTGLATVTVNQTHTATMVGNAEICEGQNTPLQVNFVNGTAPFSITYTENGVEKSISNIVANPFVFNVSPIVTTTYVLTKITDNTGCEQLIPASSGTVVVTVRPLPGIPGVITGKNIVCQGETGVSYSIAPVTGAVSYIWQMPAGFTLVAGAGTSSITVNVATDATQGIIRVYPVNGCANGAITEILVNVDNLPAKPGPITSDQGTSICQGTTGVVLRIPEVSNATSYQWQVPGGIVIVSGQGTATLQVNLDPNQSSITGDVTVTAYNGCGASIVSDPFNLTIHPSPVAFAGFDENICSSDFTFKAQNPGAGFTGTWRIIMGSGIVTSLNNPTSMVTNLAKGENKFVWTVRNNVTGCVFRDTLSVFNNTLVVTAVSASHDVCDGSTVLFGTPLPEGVTGLWTFVTGSGSFQSATSASTIVSNLSPDQNIIRWTQVKNGCVSFADVEVYNHQPSEAVILNNDFSVCGTSATISSVAPLQGTGRWTLVSGGGTIDNPLSTTINISNLAIGNNTFRWSVEKNGCIRTDDITIRNNQLIVSAGIDQTICSATTQLAGSVPPVGVTARWYIPVGQGSGSFANAFVYNTNISNLSQGTNMLVWEQNQDGCISADTVLITSNRPTTAMVGSVQTVCADTARLSGNQPLVGQGLWSVVSGFGRFDNASDPVTVVRGIMDGQNIFRWTIMENGCRSYADLIINSNKVVVYAGRDTSVCERVAYLNATPPTKGIGEWNVVPGMGSGSFFPHRFDPKARVGGLNPGTNAFIWTVTYNGCVSSDTVVVTNNTPTEANAGADQIISGNTTRLNATPAVIGTGRWTIIAGSGTFEDVTNPYSLVTNLQRGDNVLRWTVTHIGCTSFDDVIITNGQTIEANAGLDQETCNSEADLHANDPDVGIGEWSVVSGSGKIVSPGNPRSKVVDLGPGANVFRWTIYYTNSSSSDLVTITNNTPTTAYAGPDRTICRDTHVLEGVVPVVGNARWSIISGGGVIADPSLPNSAISNLSQGANVLKYEITNQGCTSIDSVRITNGLPTPAYAGTDEIICTDSLQLQPNNPSYGVGEWRVAEGTAVFDGVWAKKLSPGINRLVWVISTASCSSSDTIVVENNKPSDAFAGFDRTVCDPLVQLASNTPMIGNGTWSLISGTGSIADVTDPRTMVTNLGKGSNRFRWTIDNQGCVSFDDVEISNNLIEAFAGYDQTNCADTAVLVANNPAPGTGTWGLVGGSGSGQFDDPSNPFTTVRNLDRGQNTLTWTIRHGGCVSVSTVVITNNNPTFANAGPNVNTCDNFVTLSANNPSVGIGTWTIRNGSGTFDNMGSPTARVTDLSFGRNLFRWTVENQGCVSFDDVEVSYNTIQAVVGPTQNICSNTTILEANNPFPGTGSWSVVGGASQAVFEQISNPNTRVSNLARGRNILRWSINNVGCSTFADVEIINNSPSTAYAGNNIELCSDVTTLDATPATVGVGRWEVLTGSGVIADVNNPKSSVTGLSKGDNIFRWTVQNLTCSDADEVLVTNNQPSVPYAGADLETCSPNLSLKANIPEYGTGLWTIQQGSGNIQSATSPETFISNLAPGVNVLRWTLTKGQCAVFDEITIANNTATVANAGPDIQDCKDFAYLDANIPTHGTGLWSVVSGRGSFDNSTDAKTRVFDLGFGENILLWTVQNGNCFSTDQITIFNKVPDQAAAGSDRIICEDYVGLNANNPLSGSGKWSVLSGSGTFVDATRYDTRVNNVGFGENIYKWTISYGECTTEDLVMVTSNKSRPYAGEDDVTYTPSYNLMASNPGALQGRWSVVGGSGSFADATFFNTAVNGLSEGVNTFRWTIEVNGCIAYDDVSITYKVVPDAGFIVDTDRGCYPLTVQFTNYSVGGTSYYWDFGDGNTSLMRNPKHVYTQPGQFTAVLTVPGPDGKDAIFTQLIRVYDHPVASFEISPRTVYVPGDQIRCINTSIDARTYLWDFGDGNTSTAATPTYGYQETGFYTISLTVWNQYGCEDKMTIVDAVEALSAGFITFPNAFKPRPGVDGVPADDRNLVFKPIFSQVDQYYMQIFNRWGQLIFESFDVNVGWDGTYNGKLSPQDVYIYKVSGRFMSGKEFRTAGNVMLVR